MALAVLSLLLAVACLGTVVTRGIKEQKPGSFNVNVFQNGAYYLEVGGVSWLSSGPTFFNNNGKRYCTGEGTLKLMNHESVKGQDQFGQWNKTTFSYKAGELTVNTSVKVYTDPPLPVAIFSQTYVSDATKTQGKDRDDIISSFPSFRYHNKPTPDLGFLAYGNDMVGWVSLSLDIWNKDSNFSTGIQGGPLVIFDKSTNAMVISPLSKFMAASNKKFKDEHVSWGIMGLVDKVPADYTVDFIVSFSDKGVNQAMRDWGSYLTKTYKKTTKGRDNDLTLTHLGYWTDNGAYYYYHKEDGKNYEDTMLDVNTYLKSQGLPMKYLQIDSWFYTKGHVEGTRTWAPTEKVFPNGFDGLYEKTKLPIGCHNRFWDNDTTYASYNGGKYNFISDKKTGYAVPDDQAFWIDLFGSTQKWGKFILYEQDWLNKETDRNLALVSDIDLGRRWLMQMGKGAEKYGISIQYCMSYSRHILQSVEIPAVTQARVSDDYMATQTQYKIGITAMFADALNLGPSKDTFWSTASQPGNPYNSTEKVPYLQTLITTLSGGPVGPGDGIGYVDKEVLMRCCDFDGKILRGSRPLTIMDMSLKATAFTRRAPDGRGEILYSTISHISGYTFGLIVAVELNDSYSLVPTDLTPDYEPGQRQSVTYIYREKYMDLTEWSREKPFLVGRSQCGDELCVFHSVPAFKTTEGVTLSLHGEANIKFAPVSPQRFSNFSFRESSGLEVDVNVNPGETVTVCFGTDFAGPVTFLYIACRNKGTEPLTGRAYIRSDGLQTGCDQV